MTDQEWRDLIQALADEVYSMRSDFPCRGPEYSHHQARYNWLLRKAGIEPRYIPMKWDGKRWEPEIYNQDFREAEA